MPAALHLVEHLFTEIAINPLSAGNALPLLRKDGGVFMAEVAGSAIKFNGRSYMVGVYRDISERRAQEETLRIKNAAIAAAVNGIAIATPEGEIVYVNAAFLALWGYSHESEVCGRSVLSFWQDQGAAAQVVAAITLTGRWMGELTARLGDGKVRRFEVSAQALSDESGTILAMTGSFADVTVQRAMADALRRNEVALNEAQRIARVGSWELNLVSGQLHWSDQTYRLFEVDRAHVDPSYELFLRLVHAEDRDAVDEAYRHSLRSRQSYEMVHRLEMSDGRIKFVEEKCETDFAADGTPLISRGTAQDVTERVLTEREVHRSLAEKETLLREVHHRVKNNLQIVSSLLYFERRKVKDQQALEVFGAIRDRLRAMVLVHEKLYSSGDLSAVDFADYVRSRADQLVHSNARGGHLLQLRVDAAALNLPIETALPCGMILTELLTNIIKYAFPDNRPGEATVRLTVAYGRVQLIVRDNGVGMPPEFDADFPQSFGWQLIYNLSEQIGGSLVLDRNNGVSVTLSFPLSRRALPVEVSG